MACSAVNLQAATYCEYCGTALTARLRSEGAEPTLSGASSETASPFQWTDFAPSRDDAGFHLWSTKLPKSQFNWWAFFFPVAYLGGYGAKKSAVAVSISVLACALIFAVIHAFSYRVSALAVWGLLGFIIAISYKVAIHTDALIGKKRDFSMPMAIGLQVVYLILYGVLV